MTKTTLNFTSISQALAHFIKQGWTTADEGTDSYIMVKHVDGRKVGETIINREGFLDVVAEALEW